MKLISSLLIVSSILSLSKAQDTRPSGSPSADEGSGSDGEVITCTESSHCPEDVPCCNQYGTCGTGKFCLGGCHPVFSFSADSCMPMPVCKDTETTFDNTDQFVSYDQFLGDVDDADWVYSGFVQNYDNATIYAMPKESAGTVISSTRYLWYGKVGATLKTSRGAGVVSSFILFSNAQDEIDWEFVGNNLTSVETNFYYQAILNYTNGDKHLASSDTFEDYHDYELDWTEDELTWSLDGEVIRTLRKADTYNETSNSYQYPQTPSRVQFSIWPAGGADSAPGTVEWAGGHIDWDSEDIQNNGYYYGVLQSAYIKCYDPPNGTVINGNVSYIFDSDDNFDQEHVQISNNGTILASNDATGLDPDEGESSSSSSQSSSKSSSGSSKSSSTGSSTGTGTATTTQNGDQNGNGGDQTSATSRVTGFNQFAETTAASGTAANNVSSANEAQKVAGGILSTLAFVFTFFVAF